MKLVSVNAVLLASANGSLFVNSWLEAQHFPSFTLAVLSIIYLLLIILLQYEHRQFKQSEINISQSSWLLTKYLYLFGVGLFLTMAQKVALLDNQVHPQLKIYTLLGGSIHYSLLYYSLNLFLGVTYHWLFCKQYQRDNRCRVAWQVSSMIDQNCSICLNPIEQGQKLAKIECIHHFHASCLNKWVKKKTQCPVCLCTIQIMD